ncbi:MBL fold metallo-hydrolase [Acidobacteriota bacterium]
MFTQKRATQFCSLALAFFLISVSTFAQDFSKVEVQTIKISESIHMLLCGGGNMGISAGEDGVLVIDTSYAEMYEKIKAAVKEISDKPVQYVISTHQHFDHVNGNELFAQSGATIVAHENVRKGMEVDWIYPAFPKVEAYPGMALPILTYNESLFIHFNGEDIHIFHLGDGHTNGDSIVHFTKSNVVHMGDLYFNGGYPFIDVPHGGTVEGIIVALDHVIGMINDDTKVIPGHGPLSNRAELKKYRDMLVTVKDRVKNLIKQGKTLKEVITSKPTSDFDKVPPGMMPPDFFVKILYEDLSRK